MVAAQMIQREERVQALGIPLAAATTAAAAPRLLHAWAARMADMGMECTAGRMHMFVQIRMSCHEKLCHVHHKHCCMRQSGCTSPTAPVDQVQDSARYPRMTPMIIEIDSH